MIDNSIYIDHLPIIKVDLEVIKEIVDLLLLNFESKKIPTITFKMFRNETVVTANSLVEIESILIFGFMKLKIKLNLFLKVKDYL